MKRPKFYIVLPSASPQEQKKKENLFWYPSKMRKKMSEEEMLYRKKYSENQNRHLIGKQDITIEDMFGTARTPECDTHDIVFVRSISEIPISFKRRARVLWFYITCFFGDKK